MPNPFPMATLLWRILIMGQSSLFYCLSLYTSVSQTVVRGPQVALVFCPCGPLRLNISPKKDRKNKINVNCVSHTIVENLKQFAFKADKSRVVRRTFWLIKVVLTWKKFEKRCSTRFSERHITNLLTYLLTPCSTVLLEKLTSLQLVKKFPAFYGTRRYITAFTSYIKYDWKNNQSSTTLKL
jgi:hypothetical protein